MMDDRDLQQDEPAMDDRDLQQVEPVRPRLWNPKAAANWSLLFTPAFGAYLHAANWRTLDRPDRAAANVKWIWATAVFLVVNAGTVFVTEFKLLDRLMRLTGFILLLGWYFSQGRSQTEYVKGTLGDNYIRKGWGLPLLSGMAVIASYVAVIYFLLFASFNPDPVAVAAEIKPMILEEWHKKPELRDATIERIELLVKGNHRYTGFVDATFGGRPTRMLLSVFHDGDTVEWEVSPLEDE